MDVQEGSRDKLVSICFNELFLTHKDDKDKKEGEENEKVIMHKKQFS